MLSVAPFPLGASALSRIGARTIALLLVCLFTSACGAGRHVHDLEVERAHVVPAPQVAVILGRVADARVFEAKPPRADIPSLRDAGEIGVRSITERAYGRVRGSLGRAKGEMLLPEGRTVPALVRQVLTEALRRRGYVAVREHHPQFPRAPKIEVTIERFWSYLRPGAWVVAVEFVAQLHLRSNLPGLERGLLIEVTERLRKGMINEARWVLLVERGLAALARELSSKLPPASRSAAAPAAEKPTSGGARPTQMPPVSTSPAAPAAEKPTSGGERPTQTAGEPIEDGGQPVEAAATSQDGGQAVREALPSVED